jgi:LacI family repressor for deo operon, udp, cdd, tsx, nupC, and nupG
VTQNGEGAGPAHIEDVARRAGVSTATVSRSLRGLDRVAPRTRERVARAAQELHYVPSPAASQLASRRTQSVGVVVTTSGRWFWSEVLFGAEAVLRSAGYDTLLYIVDDPSGRRQFFDLMPLRRRVDAVMVLGSSVTGREQEALRRVDVPVVLVGGRMTGGASVRIDDSAAAVTAARHLIALGHRDVVMVCSNGSDPSSRRTTRLRRSGFERAMAEHGVDGRVVVTHPGIDGGAAAVEKLLSHGDLPTALFAETDELALGALRTLRRAGVAVPEEMSVLGFDDHELADAVELTTISRSPHAHGHSAAMQLLSALGPGASRRVDVVLPTRLVLRGTTGPPKTAGT